MILIVPCFNESERINSDIWANKNDLFDKIIFVNDGSTDTTLAILNTIASEAKIQGNDNIVIISLPQNQGKGEAVRQGVLQCLKQFPKQQTIGYCDADLSTSLDEIRRLASLSIKNQIDFLLGSRVKLAGLNIERSCIRHYLGRTSATLISIFLSISVYDTQAGAKIFKSENAKIIFEDAFISRWLFDCELILRAKKAQINIIEEPLKEWSHIAANSKINLLSYLKSFKDLVKIRFAYSKLK